MKRVAKTIVLTGASRGLGRAMTEKFIELGHTVFGCARSKDEVDKLRRQYKQPHQFAVVDVATTTKSRLGRISF